MGSKGSPKPVSEPLCLMGNGVEGAHALLWRLFFLWLALPLSLVGVGVMCGGSRKPKQQLKQTKWGFQKYTRAGEIAQWAKCLPCKHADLGSDPGVHLTLGAAKHTWNTSNRIARWEAETADSAEACEQLVFSVANKSQTRQKSRIQKPLVSTCVHVFTRTHKQVYIPTPTKRKTMCPAAG